MPKVEPRYTEQAIVMLTPDQLELLRNAADEEDRTLSWLVRKLISDYLEARYG